MSGLEDIPLVGGIAETAIHGAEAVGHAVEGDWDGAAHEAFNMAGSALHTVADDATGGLFSAAEGVYDAAAPAFGLPTSDDISHTIEHGVQDAGNTLGDAAYNLLNPSDDSGLGGGGDGGLGGGGLGGGLDDGGLGGGDMGGGDPGMDAGGGDYGDGDGGYDMSGGDGGADY